jgi:hypothetical protein
VKCTEPLEPEFIAFEFVSVTKKLKCHKSSCVSQLRAEIYCCFRETCLPPHGRRRREVPLKIWRISTRLYLKACLCVVTCGRTPRLQFFVALHRYCGNITRGHVVKSNLTQPAEAAHASCCCVGQCGYSDSQIV